MNEIANLNYDFNNTHLRVVGTFDEPWFVAQDVCDALGLKDVSDAVEKLDADEKGRASIPTLGGPQEMLIVSESGMNAIILRSRDAMTPGTPAHKYRKWVTHEVLPSIRKTGGYIHDMELFLTHQTLRDLDFRSMERTDNWCVEMLKYHLGPHMVEWFAKSHPREKQWLSGEFMAEAKKFLATFLPDGEGGLRRFPKAWRKGRASVFIDSAMSIEEGVHDYWMQYKHAGSNRPTLEDHLLKVCYCPREGTRPVDVQHLRDMQSTPEGCQQ